MTTKNAKKVAMWVFGSLVGGGVCLTVLGMAMQFWIDGAVEAKLKQVAEQGDPPAIVTLNTQVATIQTEITNVNGKIDTALESQQRFEEIFLDYLAQQANQ